MPNKNIEFEMHDFSAKVLSAFEEQVRLGLDSIGQTAEGYAKRDTPVDTGRLRNSITFATSSKQGQANTSEGAKATAEEYKKKATPEQNTVYIGTNVDYAEKIEFREMSHKTGKAHFLKDAASTHGDEYKEIMQKALKN